jgi:hypothetical protein
MTNLSIQANRSYKPLLQTVFKMPARVDFHPGRHFAKIEYLLDSCAIRIPKVTYSEDVAIRIARSEFTSSPLFV